MKSFNQLTESLNNYMNCTIVSASPAYMESLRKRLCILFKVSESLIGHYEMSGALTSGWYSG